MEIKFKSEKHLLTLATTALRTATSTLSCSSSQIVNVCSVKSFVTGLYKVNFYGFEKNPISFFKTNELSPASPERI